MSSTSIRFGFGRLLFCIAAFGAMFAWNRELGWLGVVVGFTSGTAFALIGIMATREDVGHLLRVAIACLFGALWGMMPTRYGNETILNNSIRSALLFSAAAIVINAIIRQRNSLMQKEFVDPTGERER